MGQLKACEVYLTVLKLWKTRVTSHGLEAMENMFRVACWQCENEETSSRDNKVYCATEKMAAILDFYSIKNKLGSNYEGHPASHWLEL